MLPAPATSAPLQPTSYSVTRFGAIADGVTLNTLAIQKAIDACSSAGGGVVSFPKGQYVTGTILLKSDVTLQLDPDAVLLGSLNPDDYNLVDAFTDGVNTPRGYTLIGCLGVTRVSIRGGGTIDGRGAELQRLGGKNPAAKAFLLRCVHASNLSIADVTFRNSSAWTMHLFQSSSVTVERVTIHSLGLANNDGIDIDSSQHVRITHCTIQSDDDSICLKTTSPMPCSDIEVSHCTLSSSCAALKLGTESLGDFSDIYFHDCLITKANRCAIKLLSVDGAHLSRVKVEAITVETADTPIFLRLGARLKTFRPGDSKRPVGSISNMQIKNVSVAHARRIGILIAGIPGHTIDNITFDNIQITMDGASSLSGDPPPAPAERIDSYPENNMFGPTLPAHAIYARHLTGLHAKHVQVKLGADYSAPAIVCKDGSDIILEDCTLDATNQRNPAIVLQSVRDAAIRDLTLQGSWPQSLRIEGAESNRIRFSGTPLGHVQDEVSFGDGASPSALVR